MKFSPQIYKAINTAARLHDGQERKGDGLPYIIHPVSVALMLMEHTNDEDVMIAGILHDTIEDTDYTKEQMEEEFGSRVTEFVLEVTELPKAQSWQERKDAYLEHLSSASHEARLICAADKLHNLQSMLAAVEKFGQDVHKHFNAPMDKKLWFYEECLKILQNDKEIPIQILKDINSLLETLEGPKQHTKETDIKDIYLGAVEKDGGWNVKVYIVNTSHESKELQLLQGSFNGNADAVMDLGHSPYKAITIPAKSYVEIDHMDDPGELDFTTYYNIRIGDVEYIEQINGWSFMKDKLVEIPILNQKGHFSGFGRVGKSSDSA